MLAEEQGEEGSDNQNGEQLNATMNDEEGKPVLHN